MKNIVLIIATFIVVNSSFSQSLFDKYQEYNAVKRYQMSGNMFSFLTRITGVRKELKEFKQILKKLDYIQILSTSAIEASNDIKKTVTENQENQTIDELIRICKDGKTIKIYAKQTNNEQTIIPEFFVLVTNQTIGFNTTTVSLTGNFEVGEIAKIINNKENYL